MEGSLINPPIRPSGTGRRTAPVRYRDHTVIGTPAQILNVIANHRAAGTLIAVDPPETVSAADHTVRVRLRLRDTASTRNLATPSAAQPAGWPVHRRRIGRTSAVVLAVATPVLGVVATAAYLLGRLVEWVTAHPATIAGAAAAAALITAALLRGTGRRGSRHCPGC